jgi:hypothetical protein
LTVSLDVPNATRAYWYAPANGEILRRFETTAGQQTLQVPGFTVDIALLLTPGEGPDSDRDGKVNSIDEDDDNDGVPDGMDAFPLDPEESADADGDLIGDNFDADMDADGKGDDKNQNGTPDHEEMDFDRGPKG